MPKGEHFKKPNPRINQVSFKVNDKELEKLNKLAGAANMSIPEWLRSLINEDIKTESAETAKKNNSTRTYEDSKPKDSQMSLF